MNTLLWSTDPAEINLPILTQLKEIGYDGIEFCLDAPAKESCKQLGILAQEAELKVLSVCAATPDVNPVSDDPSIRAAASQWLKQCIDNAAIAGATNLGGPMHCALGHFTGTTVTEKELERAAQFMHEAGRYGADKGVSLTPEFLNRYEAYFGNTMQQCADFLNRVDHPNVSAMFDTYHANIEEKSQPAAIRTIAPHLTHVHISENDRGTPGRGHIDFATVFTTLKEIGFSGTIAIEAFNRQNQVFADAVNIWRNFSPTEEILTEGYQLTRQGTDLIRARS